MHKESKTFALQRATNDSYHQLIVHYNLLQVVFYVYGEWHILKTRGTYLCHVLKAGGVFNASRGGKKLVPFLYRVKGRDIVFSAAFNNSSATNIWWRSASLVEETGIPGENHRPAAGHWQTWSYDVVFLIVISIIHLLTYDEVNIMIQQIVEVFSIITNPTKIWYSTRRIWPRWISNIW